MAVIGGASAFIESTLAQVYKTKDGKDFRGGPSYYMEKALGKRWMGVLFSDASDHLFCLWIQWSAVL